MRTELRNLLSSYLLGWKTIRDCSEWLAGLDFADPQLDQETRDLAGRLELIATEIAEGLRPEEEFWQEAAAFVAKETGFVYNIYTLPRSVGGATSSNNVISRTPLRITPVVPV